MCFYRRCQRFCLTAADVVTWLGFATAVALRPNDLRAGRERQLVEFFFDRRIGGTVDITCTSAARSPLFGLSNKTRLPCGKRGENRLSSH